MDKPLYKDFRSRHELNFVLRGFFHVGGTVPLTNPHGVSSSSLLGACIAGAALLRTHQLCSWS
jgi:hypothetical protein